MVQKCHQGSKMEPLEEYIPLNQTNALSNMLKRRYASGGKTKEMDYFVSLQSGLGIIQFTVN